MPATWEEIQTRLKALGYYRQDVDGDPGPMTREAIWEALKTSKPAVVPAPAPEPAPGVKRLVPKAWLQTSTLKRIHVHWTAGGHTASETDRDHYHILVEGDGEVVKGDCDLAANSVGGGSGTKAHHTLNANSGAAAVSMCAMAGAVESPFNPGKFPLTKEQWDVAAMVVAELALHYKIPVTDTTILTHAEVEKNLGIKQRGKWDIAKLPWDMSYNTAKKCGDLFRSQVNDHLAKLS